MAVIECIVMKLADLLSTEEFKSTAEVIAAFESLFPDDWEILVDKYGHRDDKHRGRHYASSTYIADRLAQMQKMGLVELKYTLDFDQEVWKHCKRMGTWRMLKMPSPDSLRSITIRVSESAYQYWKEKARDHKVSMSAFVAALVEEMSEK